MAEILVTVGYGVCVGIIGVGIFVVVGIVPFMLGKLITPNNFLGFLDDLPNPVGICVCWLWGVTCLALIGISLYSSGSAIRSLGWFQ